MLDEVKNAVIQHSSSPLKETLTETDSMDRNGLSAVQKLLLYRFLQKHGKFPKKTAYQTDKQEFEIIGAASGTSYEDLKKAKRKVDDILNLRVTQNQVHAKVKDLRKVLEIISGMDLTEIMTDIEGHVEKLTNLR